VKKAKVEARLERRKRAHGQVSPARKAPGSNKKSFPGGAKR
jgi:hypothetical protein